MGSFFPLTLHNLQEKLKELEEKVSRSNGSESWVLEKTRLKSTLDDKIIEMEQLKKEAEMKADQMEHMRKEVITFLDILQYFLKILKC